MRFYSFKINLVGYKSRTEITTDYITKQQLADVLKSSIFPVMRCYGHDDKAIVSLHNDILGILNKPCANRYRTFSNKDGITASYKILES